MKQAAFRFKPFSPRQLKVLTWWCEPSPVRGFDGIIADGAIRSGKTLPVSLSFVLWAMTCFSSENFAVCGKTVGSVRRNVIRPLKQMLYSRGYRVTERRSDNLLEISRGAAHNSFYLFGGKDEGSQDLIQGLTLAGALFDEAALMPESFVNQATARCSVEGSKWWFTCNPEGPEHWFYTGWIRQARAKNLLYLHFTMDDNLSLSARVKARYRGQYAGVFYERYILGRWAVAEGLVYPGFDAARHVVRDVPQDGRYFISIDYGTKNPFSAGLWCLFDGVATRVAEYYHDGRAKGPRTDEEHYAALERLAGGRNVEKLVIDPSASSMIEVIRRHHRFPVRAAKNEVVPGISNVSTFLAAGRLKIHESCRDCIREFRLYRWNEQGPEEKVIKENDHAMDDVRYFCRTILRRELRGVIDERDAE